MFFLVKYAKALEEASFRGRAADFLWMLLLGGATLAAAAPLAGVQFLGSSLAFMMVYVWSRRNRHVALSFLGIVTFTAPYLPWVLLALSTLLRSSAAVDVLGLGAGECFFLGGEDRGGKAARRFDFFRSHSSTLSPPLFQSGHLYYFLEDVYPRMSGGRRPLATPALLAALVDGVSGGRGARPRVEAAGRRVHVE